MENVLHDFIFTVFTPTFNRAHTLERVYQSLLVQSMQQFEWVVVDDGSSDNTKNLVDSFCNENKISIRYFFKNNGGKHTAINLGVEKAKGELFIIADSDDEFPYNALEILYDNWLSIPESERFLYTGVTGLCIDHLGNVIGDRFPAAYFDSSTAENKYIHKIKGEKWGFHRTEVLKKFPFPVHQTTNFYPEGIIWNKIGKYYKTRYVNEVVRIYHQDQEHRITTIDLQRLSKRQKIYAEYFNQDIDYIWDAPFQVLKLSIQGIRYSLHSNTSYSTQLTWLLSLKAKIVWTFSMPAGYGLYLYDRYYN